MEHGAVDRHERSAHSAVAQAARGGEIAHDEGIAHQRVNERLVLGREPERVAQVRDDSGVLRRGLSRPGHIGRMPGHDGGAPLLPARQLFEQLEPTLDVAHHDVLEGRAEKARQSLRQLGRRLDAVGHEPDDAGVLRPDERLGPRPRPLEPGVHLDEGAMAGPSLRQLALALLVGPLLRQDALLQLAEQLFEARLLFGGDFLARPEVLD